MANELTVVDVSQYPAVQRPDYMEALKANVLESGETLGINDLPQVKTPSSGGTKWTVPSPTGEEESRDVLEGILCFQRMEGALWPYEEPSEGTLPILVTRDMRTAELVGGEFGEVSPELLDKFRMEDGRYDWIKLAAPRGPFGFGTGKGRAKRVKEYRRMALLQAANPMPIVLRAGAGSAKTVTPFIHGLPVAYWRTVIKLALRENVSASGEKMVNGEKRTFKPVKYSQIVPKLLGIVSEQVGDQIRRNYTEPLRKLLSQLPMEFENGEEV